MEYKFPVIYAQESIEKSFAIHGFSMMLRYRERGSYVANKWRGGSSLPRKIFTWFVDYPMMLLYYSLARKGKIPIDQSTDHKMVTYIWKNQMKEEMSLPIKFDFISGEDVLGVPAHTTHFTHAYNGFLKNIESVRSRGGGKYL